MYGRSLLHQSFIIFEDFYSIVLGLEGTDE